MRSSVTQEKLGTAAALLIIRSLFRHLIRMPPAHLLGEALQAYPTGRRSQDVWKKTSLDYLGYASEPPTPPAPQRAEGSVHGLLRLLPLNDPDKQQKSGYMKQLVFFPLNQEVCADVSRSGPQYRLSRFESSFKVRSLETSPGIFVNHSPATQCLASTMTTN